MKAGAQPARSGGGSVRGSAPSPPPRVGQSPTARSTTATPGAAAHSARPISAAFSRFAQWCSRALGHPIAGLSALAVVLVWALLGPVCHYSEDWQLTINTGTTIVTFLMVFLIQNTQNHQGDALQVKLDELIRAVEGAQNAMIDIEEASEEELEQLKTAYRRLRDSAQSRGKAAGDPDPCPLSPDDSLSAGSH